jgi:hypothetical protein
MAQQPDDGCVLQHGNWVFNPHAVGGTTLISLDSPLGREISSLVLTDSSTRACGYTITKIERLYLPEPPEGSKTYLGFHGTTLDSASKILRGGGRFKPSQLARTGQFGFHATSKQLVTSAEWFGKSGAKTRGDGAFVLIMMRIIRGTESLEELQMSKCIFIDARDTKPTQYPMGEYYVTISFEQ